MWGLLAYLREAASALDSLGIDLKVIAHYWAVQASVRDDSQEQFLCPLAKQRLFFALTMVASQCINPLIAIITSRVPYARFRYIPKNARTYRDKKKPANPGLDPQG
ncbi:hypothetical protein SERLA73DRAFT_177752 [Serpula lacrymans var. lacrymans S7.3]|uniref:Uncharacterized protein n=1 Tax=Serpula lacrymans var. lacrymans (strain S7.3) TaxID=936435 RepID=F8PPH0_SERL3|nr:hypothetical protein SERLA73DRAFT_177752 [Serpula lacrymans var. lacrymans S7.3]